jgi:hypothetical protein
VDAAAQAALERDGTVDITTVGAHSGLPRRSEIWFLHLGGRMFITGTPGPRNWYANLRVNDRLIFHLKESHHADLSARAVPVQDTRTRRWVFSQPHRWTRWYLGEASLDDLVANAPMVELHFEEDA